MKKILVTGGEGRFANELKKIETKYKFVYLNKRQLRSLKECWKDSFSCSFFLAFFSASFEAISIITLYKKYHFSVLSFLFILKWSF